MPHKTLEQIRQAKAGLEEKQLVTLEEVVTDIEQKLSLPHGPDPETFEGLLRAWEARLEVDHPVVAAVIRDALQKLSGMGV